MKQLIALGGTAALALATVFVPGTAHAATASHIAFVRGGDIYLANADGSGVKQLTNTGEDSQPQVRGSKIVFNRGAYIWTMTTSGSNQQQWFVGFGASWDPSGRNRISYIVNRDDSGTGSCSATWQELRVQYLVPGSTPLVISNLFDCWHPAGPTTAWVTSSDSPAGSVITSQSDTNPDAPSPNGDLAIVKFPVQQGAAAQVLALINKPPRGWPPAVAATSKQVAFTTALITGQKHVYNVSANATVVTKPTQVGTDTGVQTPTFSPDGKYMLWTQGSKIREYNVATKKTVTLIANGGLSPSWG